MKYFLTFLTFFSLISYSQLSGDLSTGRTVETDIEYTLEGHKAGTLVFEIAVNMEGKVTSCTFRKDLSTVFSTPLMMEAKNRILGNLRFERGYHFPEFQYGLVTITVTAPSKP